MAVLTPVVLALAVSGCNLVFPYGQVGATDRGSGEQRAVDGSRREGRALEAQACTLGAVNTLGLAGPEDDGELEGTMGFLPDGEKPATGPAGIYIGHWDAGPTWGFFRFRLPEAVAAGTRVSAASLELLGVGATERWDPKTHGLVVAVEDTPDAPAVTTSGPDPAAPGGRKLLPGAVRWPAVGGLAWPTGQFAASPSLAAPLTARFRSGAAAGSHLQLWLRGDFTSPTAEVCVQPFVSSSPETARLTLVLCR